MDKHRETCVDWVRQVVFSVTSHLIGHLKDSVTRSPLYSIYGETIAGVTVIRAFGASSKFLRDMLRYADTVSPPLSTADHQVFMRPILEFEPLLLDVGRSVISAEISVYSIPDSMVYNSESMALCSVQLIVQCRHWFHWFCGDIIAQYYCRSSRICACIRLDCNW